MKRIQFVLIAIAFLTLVLVMVALMRNTTNSPPPKPVDIPPRGVDMQLENIHYEQTNQDAFKEWELDATSAQYFKSEERIALSAIRVTFFSNEGKIYKLSAESGEIYTNSQDVKVTGDVVVITDEGYRIEADSFYYNAEKRKIVTEDEVTLTNKEMVMTGKGMVVDLEKEKLYILKEVRALEKR